MRTRLAALFVLALAAPAAAQTAQGLSLRPFVFVSDERFIATQTFKAAFGQPNQLFWGGGLNITQDDQFYLELSASQFKKTGQRAFYANGEAFGLGIPLTATLTPLELSAGYRFHRKPPPPIRGRVAPVPKPARFIPYAGAGVGFYKYKEVSDFAVAGDDVDTQHAGLIFEGGLEARLHRWVGVAGDVHYTYIPGILGSGGVSKEAGENDLGGLSVRVKLVVGR